jgi:hypothetical protein
MWVIIVTGEGYKGVKSRLHVKRRIEKKEGIQSELQILLSEKNYGEQSFLHFGL